MEGIRPFRENAENREENVMNGTVTKLCNIDSIAIPQEMLELHVDEGTLETEIQKLSLRCARKRSAETVEMGDVVYCRGDKEAYPDGRTILLYPATALPGAEEAAKAALGKKKGDSFQASLMEKNVTLTVEKILRREPVEVNDALIAGLGIDGVKNLTEYRNYLRGKALADLKMERSKEIIRYLMDQMEAGSAFAYDEAEMEAYFRSVEQEYAAQGPMEDDGPAMDPQELRAVVISQTKQGWLAEAFCRDRGIAIDEAQAQAEADQMAEMASLMGEMPQGREELLAMARQNQCFAALFEHLDRIVNEKMGGSYGDR